MAQNEIAMDKNRMAVDVFHRLARSYEEKYMYLDLYNDTFDFFCDLLPEHAEVLELACGPGNITRYVLQKRPDLRMLATDLAPAMLELAAKNNPDAGFSLLDCREILVLGKSFDAILFGFGLPYLSKKEAQQWIADAARTLRPGGLLYLSTMEDDHERSGLQTSSDGAHQLYMYYHEAAYLTEALSAHGMDILLLERKKFTDGKTTDLVIIARKQR